MIKSPLEIAIQEIGTKEYPRNSNNVKYNTWFYNKAVSGSVYPWCMTFVQWVYCVAELTLPFKTSSCSELVNWYKRNYPECIVKKPEPNDIIIFTFGHVGIFEKFYETNRFYTIEGNTGIGNDANGGEVMRRSRNTNQISVIIRPKELQKLQKGGDKNMDIVKGSNANETKMIKAIQSAIGAISDGEIGTQTMSDIACKLNADCFPLTVKIYNAPVIITKHIVPFAGEGSKLSDWGNCINGSFYANGSPCSILVQDGEIKSKYACHASYGKNESVIYQLQNGKTYITRISSADYLPKETKWAVGGMGLLDNYNPTLEGFCKLTANGKTQDFSDVLRKTNHSMLGYKNGYIYLVYCANMTSLEVNNLAQKLGLEMAIMLDGGHIAGINGTEDFAKINTATKQFYIIQAIN